MEAAARCRRFGLARYTEDAKAGASRGGGGGRGARAGGTSGRARGADGKGQGSGWVPREAALRRRARERGGGGKGEEAGERQQHPPDTLSGRRDPDRNVYMGRGGGGRGRYGRHRVPGGTRNGAGTRRKIASRERGVSEELFCLQDAASHPKIVRLPTTAVVSERLHDWRCEGGRHGDNPDYEAPSTARLHITKWPLFICVLSASPPKHTEQVRGRRNKGGDEREDRERERMVRRDR